MGFTGRPPILKYLFMSSNTLNFSSILPVTQINPRKSYVELPAFSITDNHWRGASEIVIQFNYSASKNFVLTRRPTKPAGVNFLLCIKYRIGGTVYRYKLWENVGEVLDVALYNGQIIKKNFVLEIWNTADYTETSLETAINLALSIRTVPTSLDTLSDISDATGAQAGRAGLQVISPTFTENPVVTDGLVAYYKYDTGSSIVIGSPVTEWKDSSGNNNHMTPVTTSPVKGSYVISGETRYVPRISAGNENLGADIATVKVRELYLVVKLFGLFSSGKILFSTENDKLQIKTAGTSGFECLYDGGSVYVIDGPTDYALLHFYLKENTNDGTFDAYFDICNNNGVLATGMPGTNITEYDTTTLVVGDILGANSAKYDINALLVYNTVLTDAQKQQNKFALFSAFNTLDSGILIPSTLSDNQAWLDNS